MPAQETTEQVPDLGMVIDDQDVRCCVHGRHAGFGS
jgi:hypothetical protein